MVNVNITGQRYTGGVVATLNGSGSSISNVYATGTVSVLKNDETVGSGQFAGGITAGMTGGAHVINSYSVADVYTYYSDMWGEGGIAGYAYDESTATNSFWSTETEHATLLTEGGGTGKTDAQMKDRLTFTDAGWDFNDIWAINSGVNSGYPYLAGSLSTQGGALTIQPNNDETKTILVEQQPGTEICGNFADGTTAQKESELLTQDNAYDYPSYFVGFTLGDCTVGGTVTMHLVFAGSFDPAKTVLRKYNAVTKQYATVDTLTKSSTTINGMPALEVTYQITDGGVLDQDGLANGSITDPISLGLAQDTNLASTGASVMWYATLASALILAGFYVIRKQKY